MGNISITKKSQNLREQSKTTQKERGLVYISVFFAENSQDLLHLYLLNYYRFVLVLFLAEGVGVRGVIVGAGAEPPFFKELTYCIKSLLSGAKESAFSA